MDGTSGTVRCMSTVAIDTSAVRAQFPGLSLTQNGRPYAFFDGPGGSQVPEVVIAAMGDYLRGHNANLGGEFPTSIASDMVVARARQAAADFVGCTVDEIAFGPNMTTLNFLLAHAVARTLAKGDEIVTTELDHDGNVSPWLRVAADHGLVVRQARLHRPDGTLDLHHLESMLSPRTKIVAFTLASNALGTVLPAEHIIHAAHAVGALAWADAVHFGPHRRIDRHALGIDVLLTSPYKWFGPHLGVASIRHDLATSWPAYKVHSAADEPAGHRFETGTQSHEAQAGMTAAIDYIAGLGEGATRSQRLDSAYIRIRQHEDALALQFLAGIADLGHIHLYGIADPQRLKERVATFLFTVAGRHPDVVAKRLAAEGLAVWSGNFYASSAIEALGLEQSGGAVRVGFLHYTTDLEVDRLLEALAGLA